LLIDLKALRRRVLYDQVYSRLSRESQKPLELQRLLFPISIDVTPHIAQEMVLRLDIYKALGIDIREFGENTFIIEALAPFLSSDKIKDLIDDLNKEKVDHLSQLAMKSVNYVVENSSFYSDAMAKQLIKEFAKCTHPYREKTWVHIDDEVLSRLFKTS